MRRPDRLHIAIDINSVRLRVPALIEIMTAGREVVAATGVDETLHAKILQWITRQDPEIQPVLILVTGDGNLNHGGTTFLDVLQAAVINDWVIEIFAFRKACSRHLQNFANNCPSVSLHYLEKWYNKIIYTKPKRELGIPSIATENLNQVSVNPSSNQASSSSSSAMVPSNQAFSPNTFDRHSQSSKYRTVECRNFNQGHCRFGEHCVFRHSSLEAPSRPASTCCICLDSVKNCVIIPCGHTDFCLECAANPFLNTCPICRGPKQMVQRIFL